MFNENRVFAHSLVIESKRWSGGRVRSIWQFWGFITNIIHF